MVSYEINVKEDENVIEVSGGARFFYVIIGLLFLTVQIILMRILVAGYNDNEELSVFILAEFFFCIVLYVVASWCPFYFSLVKDKKERLLTFFAAPGCLRKKVYPLTWVSGFMVEDRGEWMGRLYVLAGKKHQVFDGYIYIVKDLASKAGEAFGLTVEYD